MLADFSDSVNESSVSLSAAAELASATVASLGRLRGRRVRRGSELYSSSSPGCDWLRVVTFTDTVEAISSANVIFRVERRLFLGLGSSALDSLSKTDRLGDVPVAGRSRLLDPAEPTLRDSDTDACGWSGHRSRDTRVFEESRSFWLEWLEDRSSPLSSFGDRFTF